MYYKDSIIIAEQEAKRMSLEHPNTIYYVIDKKRQRACCHASEWIVRNKILEGWYGVCRYVNGERKF